MRLKLRRFQTSLGSLITMEAKAIRRSHSGIELLSVENLQPRYVRRTVDTASRLYAYKDDVFFIAPYGRNFRGAEITSCA